MNYPIPFGKYLLLERINVGGMAEVFWAKTFGVEGFERMLAVKRILPNMADDDEFINMFVDEARIAVQLSHANVVQISELGRVGSQYYIAMEYVAGKDLRQILDRYRKRGETLPLPAAIFLTSKICEGLDYAHRKTDPMGRSLKLIHRDVSPQNILVSYDGATKITDFGIAKAEDRASKTQAGVLKGKFGYMSPEQVRGLDIDHRSDIFAVGILLYEMLTGKRLFLGESDFSTLEKVRNAEVAPPTSHNANIPEELERIMLKALARDRDERYGWASELSDDLQKFLIEDQAIFNGKRLAAILKEEYAEEMEAERAKMEGFLKIARPQGMEDANSVMAAGDAGGHGHSGEQTMIFESESASPTGPTSALAQPDPGLPNNAQSPGNPANAPLPPQASVAAAPPQAMGASGSGSGTFAGGPTRRSSLWIGIGIGVLLLMLGAVVGLLSGASGRTLVITSNVEGAQISLDGTVIGQTPLEYSPVAPGSHTISASSPGYEKIAYRFDLAAGSGAARLEIPLQAQASALGTLEVVSEPAGATVFLGGVPQGLTPLVLSDQDISRAIILEVGKSGFMTEVVSVVFPRGKNHFLAKVRLKSAQGDNAGNGRAQPTPTPQTPQAKPSIASAVLRGAFDISSSPAGAVVTVDGVAKGQAPLRLDDLEVGREYRVSMSLAGHEVLQQTYRAQSGAIAVAGTLKPTNLLPAKGKTKAKAKKRPRSSGCSGMGGKLSVIAVGVGDCKVRVGNLSVGVAPIFKKRTPTGRCVIEVRCLGGERFKTTKMLKAGVEDKLIIHEGDWQQ